jgi:hypothetical protein
MESEGKVRDVYAFTPVAPPDLIQTYFNGNPAPSVRYVAQVTGPFAAFAIIEVPEVEGRESQPLYLLPGLVQETFAPGGNSGGGGIDPPTLVPVKAFWVWRHQSRDFTASAIVGIRVEPGQGLHVLADVGQIRGHNGSALVAGIYDVIVEFGADSMDELMTPLMELQGVPGIRYTETSYVTDYWYRPKHGGGASA